MREFESVIVKPSFGDASIVQIEMMQDEWLLNGPVAALVAGCLAIACSPLLYHSKVYCNCRGEKPKEELTEEDKRRQQLDDMIEQFNIKYKTYAENSKKEPGCCLWPRVYLNILLHNLNIFSDLAYLILVPIYSWPLKFALTVSLFAPLIYLLSGAYDKYDRRDRMKSLKLFPAGYLGLTYPLMSKYGEDSDAEYCDYYDSEDYSGGVGGERRHENIVTEEANFGINFIWI